MTRPSYWKRQRRRLTTYPKEISPVMTGRSSSRTHSTNSLRPIYGIQHQSGICVWGCAYPYTRGTPSVQHSQIGDYQVGRSFACPNIRDEALPDYTGVSDLMGLGILLGYHARLRASRRILMANMSVILAKKVHHAIGASSRPPVSLEHFATGGCETNTTSWKDGRSETR